MNWLWKTVFVFVGIPQIVLSHVGVSVNSHGILQVQVILKPGLCQPPEILPKITVTEVGSSQSLHEETLVPWNPSPTGKDPWSFPLVTVVLPVPRTHHPTWVVTLWVDDSIVTRRLATLPRRGESLLSQVELVYPCRSFHNTNDSKSWSRYRWIWMPLLGVFGSSCCIILLPVPPQPRRVPVPVVESPMVNHRRLWVNEDSARQQQQQQQPRLDELFDLSETDPDNDDSEEYSSDSLVEEETTTSSRSIHSIGDALHPPWPQEATKTTESMSLPSGHDSPEEHQDWDHGLPLPDGGDWQVADPPDDNDHSINGLAVTAATVIDCSLSHASNGHPEGAHLAKFTNNNNDTELPPTTMVDRVPSTKTVPHGEGTDAFLISPSTLDENSGEKRERDCPSDKDSSKSYVSTLPPDSDLVSDDPVTNQQAPSTQSAIECDGQDLIPQHALLENPTATDNQPWDSADNLKGQATCSSPPSSPTHRQHSSNSRSIQSQKRKHEKSPCNPIEDAKVQRVSDRSDSDLDQLPKNQDSPSVELIQVTLAAAPSSSSSSFSRKRKVRPFSTSQIVPDWIPSKGLQTISNDFVEDSKWNIQMNGNPITPLIPSIPVPKSIHIRRSTRKRSTGNYSKA